MGRLTKTTFPDLTTEEFTYDAEGRRLTSKDREDRVTTFEYDGLGRLTKTIFPDLTFTENIYDGAGRLVETVDARGKSTFFEYDRAGRRTAVRDPLGDETVFGYDANGNQISVRDAKLESTSFEYDELNRRTKTIFPDGTFTETTYDSLGRRKSEKDQTGKITEFQYDCLGRLAKVIDALNQETIYTYDEVGNRTQQEDANNHLTGFEFDALGRETKRTLPDGTFETKEYDAAGNLKIWTKFDGNAITFDYDVNNRLTRKTFPDTSFVEFTYTDTGRRETATDSRGVTSYAYDDRDRLATLIYPDGRELEYGYDANGNRTGLTATMGTTVLTTTYRYDDASRLDMVTDPNSGQYDLDWDPNGNRSSLSQPNGTNTSYAYDALNRLTNLMTNGPSGVIQSYDYTLGLAGNRERIDEADGTVREYTYDDLYRLTAEQVSDVGGFVYQKVFEYDPVGNRGVQTTTGAGAGVVNYTYDDRDRLLTENGTVYGYDDNGNLTGKSGEATYTWDFENRLIRVEKTDGTVVTHRYDADGNRVQKEVTPPAGSPTVTNFLVDPSGRLSHVVAETDNASNLVAYYVRGVDDPLAVIRPTETRYYHADGLGSMRFLTDELGNVTDTYGYTAFGELLDHVGTDVQPYQFAGEPFEPNAGFYYNRARWLDVGTGRFASVDTFSASEEDPRTLHRYLYVSSNPVNNIDPTGFFTLATFGSFASALTTIATLRTPFSVAHFQEQQNRLVRLSPANDQLMQQAVTNCINLSPSPGCMQNVIEPLQGIGFNLENFKNYLRNGATFYDGVASQEPIDGGVFPFYAARAYLTQRGLPITGTVADVFAQTGNQQTNALTSITATSLVTFMRPSAIGAGPLNAARVFHEGLHGFGAGGDAALQTALGLDVGRATINITNLIERECF